MKRKALLVLMAAALLSGCASYVKVAAEKPAQLPELENADKLGVVVLLKVSGNNHLMIGNNGSADEQEWAVGNYNELDGSVVLGVTASNIRKNYLTPSAASEAVAESAAELFGNGSAYTYGMLKGFSLHQELVSNELESADGEKRYIQGPEVVIVNSDLDYNAKDKDLIPLAVKSGNNYGIDALVIIKAELITEGGKVTAFNSENIQGYAVGEWNNPLTIGDFFARTEIYVNELKVINAETGEYISELSNELTGYTVNGKKFYHKLEGVKDYNALRRFFASPSYVDKIRESAVFAVVPAVQYVRPHVWIHYEAE